MGSASLEFLAFGFGVAIIFNLSRAVAWRQYCLLVASIGFLAFFSLRASAFLPLAAFVAGGFVTVRLIQAGKTATLIPFLLVCVAAFIWLKKYAFIPPVLFLHYPYVTLGLSYIFFRVMHLIIDAHNGDLPQEMTLVSYLNYTLNFTTLVSGPIQRYQEFAEMQLSPVPLPLNVVVAGRALERIIVGFFKVNVLSLFLSMLQVNALTSISGSNTTGQRVLAGVLSAGAYPFYLYFNFSGYIDIVIGLARFLRIELPENFNRPFSSENYIMFWNRWHITLSAWLKTFVYNPLMIASMRRWPSPAIEPFLAVFAFFITFFLVGVWHGQTSMFIVFGILQGLGVSLVKLYQIVMARWIGRRNYNELARRYAYNVASRGLTFTWFAFSSLWFWSSWTQLDFLARSLRPSEVALIWIAIYCGSAVILALWEAARGWLLSFEFEGQPLLLSRYVRTIGDTALVVITAATIMLLDAPAPDIVYKAF